MKQVFMISLFLCMALCAYAQEEQVYKPIILQVNNDKGIDTYSLESFSYNVAQYQKDSVTNQPIPVLQLNLSLQTKPDKTLFEWLTVTGAEKSGSVLLRDIRTGAIQRTFTFKGAQILSWSESVSDYSFREVKMTSIHIEIKCKEYTMENYSLKNFKSYYDE